jgi:N-methyl-L-proline demethylase
MPVVSSLVVDRKRADPLLEPYTLRHLTLRNRVMSTAHEPAYSEDGLPKDRYRLYHLEKAKGGIALTMTAGSAIVSADSPPAFGNLHAYRDEIVPWLKRLTDDVHEAGAAVMIQITHLGRRTGWNKGDWLPVLAPSSIREPAHRAIPKQAEAWDLDRIAADYADAAERMKAAGMDGIELEAYGHLLDQFWSPATNRRTDEHNGSLENRLRFTHRVLSAIRERVGADFIVGIRMALDEQWDLGFSKEEGLAIAQNLVASRRIDFINLIRGHIDTDAALAKVIPIHGMASAPHLDFAGEVRAATKFPIFHAAKIDNAATARHAIASGLLDMVGMTRAHMADPHIVRKIMAGQEDRIRPCVGVTYCLDRIYEGNEALCAHNAATGREASMPHDIPRASRPIKAVVIGGGPGGLEAARVLTERGHQVTLFEAQPRLGGQIRLLAQSPRRKDLMGIIDWRAAELDRMGVAVHLSRYAETDDVLAENPGLVVVAAGGLPQMPHELKGAEFAVSSWDILSGDVAMAQDVLVYDDHGGHAGMQAAEKIADSGAQLEIVSPERFFAPEMGGLSHVPYAAAFNRHGVRVTINTRVTAIAREGNRLKATLGSDYGAETQERFVDQIVVEHGTTPLDDLYQALKPHSVNGGAVDYRELMIGRSQTVVSNANAAFRLWRIGDAVASRNIHAAVYDALRLCKDA